MNGMHTLPEFQKIAKDFILGLTTFSDRATVVGLYGDLGAGKTTFVQTAAKALGVTEMVTSPTFLILKSYELKAKSYKLLHHIDAYRLKNSDELRKLRFDELLANPTNLILIEWADKVIDLLPSKHIAIHLQFIDDSTRAITID